VKISDTVIRTRDRELVGFMDEVQAIFNNGLYEQRVVGSIPTWQGNNGETAIYFTGAVRAYYFRINGIWASIGFNTLGALTLFDADYDTGITPEATVDEDVLRFYTAGIYKFAMDNVHGFSMAANTPVCFNGTDESVKWVYDTADSYMKCYVGGAVRMEM